MHRLSRRKSISCEEIRFTINGISVSPGKEYELNFNEQRKLLPTTPHGLSKNTNQFERTYDENYLSIPSKARRRSNSKYSSTSSLYRERSHSASELVDMVDRSLIGKNVVYKGPFGPRHVIYLDHTASGKPLKCIEDFIQDNVLPYYANTHTVSSFTSVQTTAYREEARDLVRQATGGEGDDVVLFYGSGTTGCVHKLVHHVFYSEGSTKRTKIVFIGPFEHHSNILPWQETGAQIVNIPVNKYGLIDMKYLKMKLKEVTRESKNVDLIGCFSIASNVTGVVSDDVALTILMHKYGGIAFFDYAAGAPHVKVIMNPKLDDKRLEILARKDAIYFSGHKFMGGPQTTGVLVAKRHIFKNPAPHGHGGGTVNLVTLSTHSYLHDIIEREEGGTPSIVENIRLGLVMKLKMSIGEENIIAREAYFTRKAFSTWSKIPNLIVLGDTTNPRIPIISFLIEHVPSGYYLHHNFVATLLNDLFGIQARGGCMCAGPYSQILLEVDEDLAIEYEDIFARPSGVENGGGDELMFKPGFTRLSFPYHASPEEVEYTIQAVTFLAENGWKLLPLYKCNVKTGTYTYMNPSTVSQTKSLLSCNFGANGLQYDEGNFQEEYNGQSPTLKESMDFATDIVRKLNPASIRENDEYINPASQKLRWFLLPSEAVDELKNPNNHGLSPRAFRAKKTQFKTKSLKHVKSKTYEGSVLDQVLNSVWGDEKHLLTQEFLAEDSRMRNVHAPVTDNLDSSLTTYSSSDCSVSSRTSGDQLYGLWQREYSSEKMHSVTERQENTVKLLATTKDMDEFIMHFGKSRWLP